MDHNIWVVSAVENWYEITNLECSKGCHESTRISDFILSHEFTKWKSSISIFIKFVK